MSTPSIAIIGLEGSGKTVLMTVLAKKLTSLPEAGGYMNPIGTQTMRQVENTWATLQRGEWPPFTSPEEIFSLTWKMYIQRDDQQIESDVRLIDMAGQSTRMLFGGDDFQSETREYLKPFVEYISNASVVLFVLNIKDYIAETDEARRIDNQVVLKSALDQLSGTKNILLVFAQYDQYEAFVNENGGLDAFCQKYLPYIYNAYIGAEKKVFGTKQIPMMCIAAVNDTQVKICEDGVAMRVPVPNFSSRGLTELCQWIIEKIYEEEAKKRSAEELLRRGDEYYESQDWVKAVECYRQAVELGNVAAQSKLGLCYANGNGVEKDENEAVKWWHKAAEQGFIAAQYNLGLYYSGNGQDYTEAVKWWYKAAEQGLAMAQSKLGLCYAQGNGVERNDTKAITWWRKAAAQGDAEAQRRLGLCYQEGRGIQQNSVEAVKWYRKAAEQGDVKAQAWLGLCYQDGRGIQQNSVEAVKWYRKAAEQGFVCAQVLLGVCYEQGNGVQQNFTEAVKWYLKATEQGNVSAQSRLGMCYEQGNGVQQNFTEAVKWYRMAAEQGDDIAQFNLGMCYAKGDGVQQNDTEAVKWWRKAAEQGLMAAQYVLGRYYATGYVTDNGIVRDRIEAKKWLSKAAAQGDERAQDALKNIDGDWLSKLASSISNIFK